MMLEPELPDPSPSGWEQAIVAIADRPGIVVVLGASDSGKTTWTTCAIQQLSRAGVLPLAVVDADIGQSTVGPPATVALSLLREVPREKLSLDALPYDALSFIGSVSPVGHLLQTLSSTARLAERATRSGAKTVLVDTTGLVTPGIGFQLKLRKIELLDPTHLVALQRAAELEPLLSVFGGREGLCIHRLAVSRSARCRTPAERALYRARRFAAYFAQARSVALAATQVLILAPRPGRYRLGSNSTSDFVSAGALRAEELSGLLIGLNTSADETVGLGLLDGLSNDGREIVVRTPLTDASAVRILQLGSMRLDPSGHER